MEQTPKTTQNSAKLAHAYKVWVMCKNYVADPAEGSNPKASLDKLY